MAIVQVQFGGKGGTVFELETNEDLVVVRTMDDSPISEARLSGGSRLLLDGLEPLATFADAGVEVFHVRSGAQAERDVVRAALTAEPAVRFAGRVLTDLAYKPTTPMPPSEVPVPSLKEPVLYSENLFIKFAGAQKASAARKAIAASNLKVKREIDYLQNGFFVEAPEGIGLEVFDLALTLLRQGEGVEYCHPELLRPREFRKAFPREWHLKTLKLGGATISASANVVAAWKRSTGKGTTIAIIDDGVDIDHEEFGTAGKIVAPRDATGGVTDPGDARPKRSDDVHGTPCAGVACANGRKGASGVAPGAKLMPIRLRSGLGSQAEADAFAWAADNGADVISCSWGPTDGRWWRPDDPAHTAFVPLPDNTRLAIEYALNEGRGGKGCVICWAGGNGNESVDNDGYASHPGVIAVGSCNDTGTRSVYSDTGKALWCVFPSGDFEFDALATVPPASQGGVWDVSHPRPSTPGIWTTDWSGSSGYNRGGSTDKGDVNGHYTNSFTGTSSSAPGVAGVAALVLALNKALRHDEVKDILRRACDQIDPGSGQYDPGTGHSLLYGYGRVNALKAVSLAVSSPIAGPGAMPKAAKRKTAKRKTAKRKTVPARRRTPGARKKR
jgi:subtilisin family serine protease